MSKFIRRALCLCALLSAAAVSFAEESVRPMWAQRTVITFFNGEAEGYLGSTGVEIPSQEGIFVSGYGDSLLSALVQCLTSAISFIDTSLKAYSTDPDPATDVYSATSMTSDISPLMNVLDTYTDGDGRVYALSFFANEDLMYAIRNPGEFSTVMNYVYIDGLEAYEETTFISAPLPEADARGAGGNFRQRAAVRPAWVGPGIMFRTDETSRFISSAGIPESQGVFVSGSGESLVGAIIDGLVNMNMYCDDTVVKMSTATNNGRTEIVSVERCASAEDYVQIIDQYADTYGSYVLLFMSDADIAAVRSGQGSVFGGVKYMERLSSTVDYVSGKREEKTELKFVYEY